MPSLRGQRRDETEAERPLEFGRKRRREALPRAFLRIVRPPRPKECWNEIGDESRPKIVRVVGQLEPFTSDFVSKQLLMNPALSPKKVDDNIRMSARFLRFLLDQTGGAPGMAVAAYYQGLIPTRQGKLYEETKRYVAGVSASRGQF